MQKSTGLCWHTAFLVATIAAGMALLSGCGGGTLCCAKSGGTGNTEVVITSTDPVSQPPVAEKEGELK